MYGHVRSWAKCLSRFASPLSLDLLRLRTPTSPQSPLSSAFSLATLFSDVLWSLTSRHAIAVAVSVPSARAGLMKAAFPRTPSFDAAFIRKLLAIAFAVKGEGHQQLCKLPTARPAITLQAVSVESSKLCTIMSLEQSTCSDTLTMPSSMFSVLDCRSARCSTLSELGSYLVRVLFLVNAVFLICSNDI